MLVRERMIAAGKRISSVLPLSTAVEIYEQSGLEWMPVVDQEGHLLGLLTSAEITKAKDILAAEENSDKKFYAQDLMKTRYLFVTENTPIEEAVRIMVDYDVSDLPVVKDGYYTGIVTEKNMLRVLMEVTAARRQGVRLTVQLENKTGELLSLLQLINDQGGMIHGLCTCSTEETEYMLTTMRVEGVDKYSLKQALKNAGKKVVDIR